MAQSLECASACDGRRHKKRKQEEVQFIKGNKKHHGGYSSGGGLTSKPPIVDGNNLMPHLVDCVGTLAHLLLDLTCCMRR